MCNCCVILKKSRIQKKTCKPIKFFILWLEKVPTHALGYKYRTSGLTTLSDIQTKTKLKMKSSSIFLMSLSEIFQNFARLSLMNNEIYYQHNSVPIWPGVCVKIYVEPQIWTAMTFKKGTKHNIVWDNLHSLTVFFFKCFHS